LTAAAGLRSEAAKKFVTFSARQRLKTKKAVAPDGSRWLTEGSHRYRFPGLTVRVFSFSLA
jgi:hypothetical protein